MRLIDADALKEDYRMADDCKDCKTNVRDCEYDHIYAKMEFCGWLDDASTVDAVPVVRCNDCKNWDERRGRKYCWEMYFDQSDPDFYCGYAERRKDG